MCRRYWRGVGLNRGQIFAGLAIKQTKTLRCTVAVVWGGIPWSPVCRMLNIYVLIGCWLKKWCTWVRTETHAFRKTGNSAAAILAPSMCPHLEFHSRLHARCVPRHMPQLWSVSTVVILCPPIPMLSPGNPKRGSTWWLARWNGRCLL